MPYLPSANEVCQGYVFTGVCLSTGGGGWHTSMHCRWYPNMPCSRSPGGCGIPACLADFQAHTQGGILGGSGWGGGGPPGPHPRGKLRGIWSRPTPKWEVEGDLVQAHTQEGSWGGSGPGPHPRGEVEGDLARGVPGVRGACSGGACFRLGVETPPPWRLLLRVVRILLEYILVLIMFACAWCQQGLKTYYSLTNLLNKHKIIERRKFTGDICMGWYAN